MQTVVLNPSALLDGSPHGKIHAMAQTLLLIAFHHRASALEYRTMDGICRVAQIIDGIAYEYPTPPEQVIEETCAYFQGINDESESRDRYTCAVEVELSKAEIECVFNDEQNLVIYLKQRFDPPINVLPTITKFWYDNARRRGWYAVVQFKLQRLYWQIEDWLTTR